MYFTTLKLNKSEIFVTFKVLIWVFISVCQFQNVVSLSTYKTLHIEQGFCQVTVLFHTSRVQYCCTQLTSNSSHYIWPHLRYDVYFEISLLKFNRPFPHYAPVSKQKEIRTRLGWTISYKSLYFVQPSGKGLYVFIFMLLGYDILNLRKAL